MLQLLQSCNLPQTLLDFVLNILNQLTSPQLWWLIDLVDSKKNAVFLAAVPIDQHDGLSTAKCRGVFLQTLRM